MSPHASHILAIDMGATKTDLALYALPTANNSALPRQVKLLREQRHATSAAMQFKAHVENFLGADKSSLQTAVVAIAGVMSEQLDQPVLAPNIQWPVIPAELQHLLGQAGIDHTLFLNDLHAIAYGVPTQLKEHLLVLNPGKNSSGNRAVLAIGTGLGEATLYHHDDGYLPSASEGGHTDFGPTDELQVELWRFFKQVYKDVGGHVSYERILCGDGIKTIYDFLARRQSQAVAPTTTTATIVESALRSQDSLAVETVRLFVQILAAEAANLALKSLALGGVYIGGGIPPRILPFLQEPAFLPAFTAKGRYRNLLADLPVKVLLNPRVALEGAVNYFLSRAN